jgi:hypothetical protein
MACGYSIRAGKGVGVMPTCAGWVSWSGGGPGRNHAGVAMCARTCCDRGSKARYTPIFRIIGVANCIGASGEHPVQCFREQFLIRFEE